MSSYAQNQINKTKIDNIKEIAINISLEIEAAKQKAIAKLTNPHDIKTIESATNRIVTQIQHKLKKQTGVNSRITIVKPIYT